MIEPLTEIDLQKLKDRLKENWQFQVKLAAWCFLIGLLIAFIPLGISPKGIAGNTVGNLIHIWGVGGAFATVYGVSAFLWLISYLYNIPALRTDIRTKKKVVAKLKVNRVEHLKEDLAEKMEGKKDTFLHFEPNNYGVKDFIFKKSDNPEYLNAKHVLLEQAKYSKFVLNSKVVTT